MTRKCETCGADMIQLFTSWVCSMNCHLAEALIKDGDGKVWYIGNKSCRKPGWVPKELDGTEMLGRPLCEHIDPEVSEQCNKCIHEGGHSGQGTDSCCGNAFDENPCPGFEPKYAIDQLEFVRTSQPFEDFGLWRCECGERPQSFSNGEKFWYQCINQKCECKSESRPADSVQQAKLNWNMLLKGLQKWTNVGEVTEINAETTHNLDQMFMLGKLEPMLHEVSVECRMNIKVVDDIPSENGTIKVNRDFDLMEQQLIDADIWTTMVQLSKDEHSGFKQMFLYRRGGDVTQYRLEFIFEE